MITYLWTTPYLKANHCQGCIFSNSCPFFLFPSMLFFVQNKAMLSTSLHCTVFSDKGKELLRWPIKFLGCVHSPYPLLSRLSFKGGLLSFRIWLFQFWESIYAHYYNLCQFNVAQPQPIPNSCKRAWQNHTKGPHGFWILIRYGSTMAKRRRWRLKEWTMEQCISQVSKSIFFQTICNSYKSAKGFDTHAQARTKLNQFQCQSITIF